MHTYSLIHDDLPCMDDDDLRRGKPTCHVAFGEATALLAGDALLARAFEIAARNQHCGRAAEAVAELARSAGSFGMIGGQFLDLCGEEHALDFNTIMRMYRLKTGALIIASARLGCIAAGLDREDARSRAAAVYAENVGLTFQIIDDLLDLIGSTELLGKATQKDAARGKTTIMSCLSPEEAKKYAAGLTGAAVASIAGYPGSDLLSLAYYLLEQRLMTENKPMRADTPAIHRTKSRQSARRSGRICRIDGRQVVKPSEMVDAALPQRRHLQRRYVSRGGKRGGIDYLRWCDRYDSRGYRRLNRRLATACSARGGAGFALDSGSSQLPRRFSRRAGCEH